MPDMVGVNRLASPKPPHAGDNKLHGKDSGAKAKKGQPSCEPRGLSRVCLRRR
jgi:hypothetical protein